MTSCSGGAREGCLSHSLRSKKTSPLSPATAELRCEGEVGVSQVEGQGREGVQELRWLQMQGPALTAVTLGGAKRSDRKSRRAPNPEDIKHRERDSGPYGQGLGRALKGFREGKLR